MIITTTIEQAKRKIEDTSCFNLDSNDIALKLSEANAIANVAIAEQLKRIADILEFGTNTGPQALRRP